MNDRVSFRQVGKEKPGKVYKGVIIDAYNRSNQPTIPAKYEQVLAKQELRKDGFGRRAQRFILEATEPCPGPGQYQASESPSPSFSKKGFLSGFVSKLSRFRKREFATFVPGPGAYSPVHMRTMSNPSPSISPLKAPSNLSKYSTPAPGTYDIEQAWKPKDLITTFKSREERLMSVTLSPAPPPSHYSPNFASVWPAKGLTSPFKLPLNPRRFKVNMYDPHALIEEESVPGPGHYSLSSSFDKGAASGSFQHQGLDRFGNPIRLLRPRDSLPGPGAYNLPPKPLGKAPIQGSFFMSESDRAALALGPNPGPAFYKPDKGNKKKSFHLNLERRWV